ncbi:hypothetical protein Tco_0942404 [Tanacetum coccineum]
MEPCLQCLNIYLAAFVFDVEVVYFLLELPLFRYQGVHLLLVFHVSNLKKCYSDEPLAVPLEGLHVDDKLRFVEEPVEIMDREVKRLKQSRIPIVKLEVNTVRLKKLVLLAEVSDASRVSTASRS